MGRRPVAKEQLFYLSSVPMRHDPTQGSNNSEVGTQADELLPLVYEELRRLAAGMLRHRRALTIQPTVLVHEAFMKLSSEHSSRWHNENHFRAVAAIAMRRVLADHAKSRRRLKRGGGRVAVTLGEVSVTETQPDLGAIDELLKELEAECPRVAQLVIYRFFGDLDVASAAERLGVSLSTAEADWRFARAWLSSRLREPIG